AHAAVAKLRPSSEHAAAARARTAVPVIQSTAKRWSRLSLSSFVRNSDARAAASLRTSSNGRQWHVTCAPEAAMLRRRIEIRLATKCFVADRLQARLDECAKGAPFKCGDAQTPPPCAMTERVVCHAELERRLYLFGRL